MAFVKNETMSGALAPPWDKAPLGVVSLFAMLEFAACDFLTICYIFGEIRGRFEQNKPMRSDVYSDFLTRLIHHCGRLGFNVTRDQIYRMMLEIGDKVPGSLQISTEGTFLENGQLDWDRTAHFAEMLYTTLNSEVSSILFLAIPRERVDYVKEGWLKGSPIPDRFPTAFKELESAASCYAVGEATASVFHSMRALEPSLNALADNFGVSFSHENWQVVIERIESNVRQLGQQPKSSQKLEDEKFFGGATSHLYFVKNAWRNHVAHTRETYNDADALKIMDRTVQFIESLCPRLKEPGT